LADDEDPLANAEALIEAGKPHEAVTLLDALHEAGRGGLLLQSARVSALIAAGETERALEVAREASSLYPQIATAAVSLGEALLARGHLATAIGEFQRALRIDPDFIEARTFLGCAWLEAGEAEKAAEALDLIPVDVATPMLIAKRAEIEAMRARARSDARYVRHLFDQFSSDYDARMLDQLGYSAPQILRNLAELIGLSHRGKLAILDLGCGTGLAGLAFRDLAARLDGIDLSPAMVEKARAREIYDEVRVGDIETALGETDRIYDLILAADTLVYLGDLAPLLRAAATSLSPDGVFLFTVERKDGDGYELGPKRRWRHSEAYLRDESERAGLSVAGFLECSPRTEAKQPVEGYAVALERRARR
jgi:predicted TPR repeat methyltransferase